MEWTPSAVLGALGAGGTILWHLIRLSQQLGRVLAQLEQMRKDLDGKAGGSDTAMRLAGLHERIVERPTIDRMAAVEQRVARIERRADKDHGAPDA